MAGFLGETKGNVAKLSLCNLSARDTSVCLCQKKRTINPICETLCFICVSIGGQYGRAPWEDKGKCG